MAEHILNIPVKKRSYRYKMSKYDLNPSFAKYVNTLEMLRQSFFPTFSK